MKFLTIAYALKVKQIYKDIEPKMESIIYSTLHRKDTDNVVKAVYPYAEKAFQEGVEFGNFISGRKMEYELTGRDKKKLFERYINALQTAHQIYLLQIKKLSEDGGHKQDLFFREYVGTMKKATSRLLTDAGAYGMRKAVRRENGKI